MVMVPMHSFSPLQQERFTEQVHHQNSLLHPPYPSPVQSDSEPSRYATDGLGLYPYSQPYPTSAQRTVFSNSPQIAQGWNGSQEVGPPPLVNPWTSGAFDHPVCPDNRWNTLWAEYPSHRSSTSSQREMSVFSGDGSEHSFPPIKLEGGADWTMDTVAPDRLSSGTYDGAFKVEGPGETSPSKSSLLGNAKLDGPRDRHHRRSKIPPEEAKFVCNICNVGFVRAYNKKTHMARHDSNRTKEHVCAEDGCEMKFERRTDLIRHVGSVHLRIKDYRCEACGKSFARKDTKNRYVCVDGS